MVYEQDFIYFMKSLSLRRHHCSALFSLWLHHSAKSKCAVIENALWINVTQDSDLILLKEKFPPNCPDIQKSASMLNSYFSSLSNYILYSSYEYFKYSWYSCTVNNSGNKILIVILDVFILSHFLKTQNSKPTDQVCTN